MALDEGFGESSTPDAGVESIKSDSTKKRTVFFGLSYGSNSSFLGRYQAKLLPYYSADVSYKSKTGLWLSLFTYDVANSNSFIDEVDVMLGWTKDLSKRVDASLYYTRYFFTGSSELIKASVANTTSGAIGYDWRILYSKISAHYIFGDMHDFFVVFENSRYFEVPGFFDDQDYFSCDPKISIISGTQTFVDTYYINQGTPLVNPGNPSRGGRPSGGGTTTTAEQSSQTTFSVLSYELSLPIAYNKGRFAFEVNGRYSIPVNLLDGDTSKPQFFFTGGITYFLQSK